MDMARAINMIVNNVIVAGLMVFVSCQSENKSTRSTNPVKTAATPMSTVRSQKEPSPISSGQNNDECTNLNLADTAVNYDTNIAPFLKANCTMSRCHAVGARSPDLTTYTKVKAEGEASFAAIEDGSMPPGKLIATKDKDLFKAWLEGGALESSLSPSASPAPSMQPTARAKPSSTSTSATTPTATPRCNVLEDDQSSTSSTNTSSTPSTSTAVVTYDVEIKALFSEYCISCHGTNGTRPNLTTFDKVRASGTKIGKEIQNGSMPPPNSNIKMTAVEKKLYATWASGGYLN